MSDTVTELYNQVLEDLGLDGCPIEDYDILDKASLIVDLERTFNIKISDNKANELFKQESHESWIDHIRGLL